MTIGKKEPDMIIHSVALPLANQLANDYLLDKPQATQFFAYAPYQPDSYRNRLEWLRSRQYPHRKQLADGLAQYNRQIGNDPVALEQIEKLRKDDTYVVVAGQQAGVLTGPLYTIHKAISLIQTARRLQTELGVDVVPVFWIAGEDHDIDEIDHVYLAKDETTLHKQKIELKRQKRTSASMLTVETSVMTQFVETFFAEHAETVYTQSLRCLLRKTAEQAGTLVDWFARIMAHLFGKHGLVLIESSSAFVRQLEQPVFRKVIEHNEQIAALLKAAEERLHAAGYPSQLQLDEAQAHLFIYADGERLLLRREGDHFYTKDRRVSYTRDELLALLETDPQRFSANVVSRPLMQEHLFPTLAFIGGPGEIAYWAFYRKYFEYMGYELPIVLPRISFTLVEGAVERILSQMELPIETVLQDFAGWKQNWLAGLQTDVLAERFKQTRQAIKELYQPLVDEVVNLDRGMQELAAKNMERLLQQVDFLQERTQKSILNRHEVAIKRLNRMESSLIPEGQWQERVFNIFSFANKYGLDLIDRLVEAPVEFDRCHKVVYL
jgi:bacillithiol biosynthesis cysteine-adding enzyme BshC